MEITLRTPFASDVDFAREVHHRAYHDVVVEQYGSWDESAQDRYFQQSWNSAAHEIVLCEVTPCGYVCIEERPDDIHIRELVIDPDFQNRGIGSFLLHQVMARAQIRQVPVRLGTCQRNRAFQLYQKLGFREFSRTKTHFLLQWTPQPLL